MISPYPPLLDSIVFLSTGLVLVLFVLSMLTALTWFMGFCVRLSQKTPCTESCVAMDPKKVVAITAAVHSFLGDSVKVVSVQPSCNQKTN